MALIDFMDESSELVMESKTVTEDDIKKLQNKVNELKNKKYLKSDNIKDIIHECFAVFIASFNTGAAIGLSPLFAVAPILMVGVIIDTIIAIILIKITTPKTKLSLLNQTMNEISKLIKVANKSLEKAEGKDKEKIEKYISQLKSEKEKCAKEIEKVQKQIQVKNFDESFASLFEGTDVDYAPVNEPIEGEDIGELPKEKQPDYVPNGYEEGDPKDNSTTESSLSNFDDDYLMEARSDLDSVSRAKNKGDFDDDKRKDIEDRTEKYFYHAMKHNKKDALDLKGMMNDDKDAEFRVLSKVARMKDAEDRHNRRHKNEGAINFI